MKHVTTPPDLLSTGEAAVLLGMSDSAVLRAGGCVDLRYMRTPGGHRRCWKAAVLEYRARLAGVPKSEETE